MADLVLLSQIEGFLKAQFKGALTQDYKNAIFNSGIENNSSFVESISLGQKFVFRWRAAVRDSNEPEYILSEDTEVNTNKTYYERSLEEPYIYTKINEPASDSNPSVLGWYEKSSKSDIDCLVPYENLRLLVAKYTQDDPNPYKNYYKHIDPNNIILNFELAAGENEPAELNNIITGGSLRDVYVLTQDIAIIEGKNYYTRSGEEGAYIYTLVEFPEIQYLYLYYEISNKEYVIDNIVQTPSTKYIYKDNNNEYIWNGLKGDFELKTDSNYLPYYYLTATAKQAVTNSELSDPTQKFGIFIYTTDGASPVYIQDIQLTRFVSDGADTTGQTPVLIGNIPIATSNQTEHYYLKPADGVAAEEIETYISLEELANALDIQPDVIKPVYNENSEKVLSISVSQSNCFNILQTIAETFECWVDLKVIHNAQGYIQRDNDGRPRKYVYLNEYAGDDNWAGFKYGINLNAIERTVNSDEIVSKLIVDLSQSEYVDEGFVSIGNAPSNQSGESYILNFDYYYSQDLLDKTKAEPDRLKFISDIAEKNLELQAKEKERRNLESAMTSLGSNRNVFTELVDTAKDTQTRALAEFEDLTGQSYDDYRKTHTSLTEDSQLTEEETIYKLLGELYVSSATINNYSGILTNIEQEYWKVRKQLKGSENYNVKIWVDRDENLVRHVFVELNDYLPDFTFTIGGSSYTSTVSKKYWDLEKDDTIITFTAPEGYSVETSQYNINDNKVAKFKITSAQTVLGIEDEIEEIQEEKQQLTNEFNNKYSRFIQEGTWNSTDYIDSELYYLDALQVSNTSAQPAVSYTINVVEISELEGFEWYMFDAGDKTYVEDTEFLGWTNINVGTTNEPHYMRTPAREEVIVAEVEWHLDEPDQNVITVQNYKTQFEDLFQRISAAVQTVQYNEATYAKISSFLDANGTLNQDVLLESLNRISGQNYALTSDGSVLIDGDNILIQNLNNPANRVIINSEGIRVSSDGGQNWQTAIDGQGINIGTVYTGTLNTNNVVIGSDDNPSFRWDKAGISAYKSNEETGIYDLQTFVRYDQYGLYGIKNNRAFKAQNLNDVLKKAHFAVTWDGFFIKNNYEGGGRVEITSDNDFRVLNDPLNQGNLQEKIKIGALEWGEGIISPDESGATTEPTLYGIRIRNDDGVEVIKTGDNGNITITGTINALGGNFGEQVTVGKDREPEYMRTLDQVVDFEKTYYEEQPVFDYVLTQDITPDEETTYYRYEQGIYIEISKPYPAVNPSEEGWFVLEEVGKEYTEILNPDPNVNPHEQDWYELVNDLPYVVIDGLDGSIYSSNYSSTSPEGWIINSDGDAIFNNISARGAIKTSVFEYSEVQAVGGIFMFRPSAVIQKAYTVGEDIVLEVSQPELFEVNDWCKIGNYIGDDYVQLANSGLANIYRIKSVNGLEVILEGAAELFGG